jgi:hypothetical protein
MDLVNEYKSFSIHKQLEILVSRGKVKYVKKLLKTYTFNNDILQNILRRLCRYIKNNPNLENIDDYISIRHLFIRLLEPDLFVPF